MDVVKPAAGLVVTLALAFSLNARATEPSDDDVILPAVTFLSDAPRIDGTLDASLTSLPVRQFPHFESSDDSEADPTAGYRLAYGTGFLYLYVEAAGELVFRDRAFQNGDGFHTVIAKPLAADEPSEEFYVLACSAVNDPAKEWSRRVFWYHDVDRIFERTSDDTMLAFAERGGRIAFELLLPWKDIHPFHPWLSGGIGFNLRFVKAFGEADRSRYSVMNDPDIDRENRPRRYRRLRFETPRLENGLQAFVRLDASHVDEGETVSARIATLAAARSVVKLRTRVETGEGEAALLSRADLEAGAGLETHLVEIEGAGTLPSGGYEAAWRILETPLSGSLPFTVLPPFDAGEVASRLARLPATISTGSRTTMELLATEIARDLGAKRADETCGAERLEIARLEGFLDAAAKGDDRLAARTGSFRRGFRSAMDGTLQPYAVHVAATLDRSARRPLVVYLHGSASDETDLFTHAFVASDGAIAIAPFGRGPSHGWHEGHAQTDVAEAVDDAVASYGADEARIVLAGFSMGGYGVYRTFLETPERYRAVASFSGAPSLGSSDGPDFLDEKNLDVFREVPVFIFHGAKDRNLPVEPVRLLADKLRAAGASVTLVVEDDKGHEAPGPASILAYQSWLVSVLGHGK